MDGVRTPVEGLVDAGAEPVFAFYLGNQVNKKLTIGDVNSAHYTGDFAYTNLESTSYWQVNLDGLKLNGAAVGSTPYAIVETGTSLLAGPTTDVKSIAAWLSLSSLARHGPRLARWWAPDPRLLHSQEENLQHIHLLRVSPVQSAPREVLRTQALFFRPAMILCGASRHRG